MRSGNVRGACALSEGDAYKSIGRALSRDIGTYEGGDSDGSAGRGGAEPQ